MKQTSKDKLIRILLDKNISAKTIALMCISLMSEEQVAELLRVNDLALYDDKHEVIT